MDKDRGLKTVARPAMAEEPKFLDMLSTFVIVWGIRLTVGLFVLTLLYSPIFIIFRYVFGVELWSPFR
jgi:hypothetical protein